MLRHSYDNCKINHKQYHKWRTYDRFAIDLTILLGQILRHSVNRATDLCFLIDFWVYRLIIIVMSAIALRHCSTSPLAVQIPFYPTAAWGTASHWQFSGYGLVFEVANKWSKQKIFHASFSFAALAVYTRSHGFEIGHQKYRSS